MVQPRQPIDLCLHLAPRAQEKQPAQGESRFLNRALGRIQEPQADGRLAVDQGRIGLHRQAAARDVDLRGKLVKVPCGQTVAIPARIVDGRKGLGRLGAQLPPQGIQVSAGRQRLAVGIRHADVHLQLRRQSPFLEIAGGNQHAADSAQGTGNFGPQTSVAVVKFGHDPFRRFRRGHETRPQGLGQRADQGQYLFFQQARHEPGQRLRLHLVERFQRHRDRHAIVRLARLEFVVQRQFPGTRG